MRVLFYEPDHTGHHFVYLARMLPAFVDLPVQLVLATTQAGAESSERAAVLSEFEPRLRIEPCCTPAPQSRPGANARHRFNELVAAVRREAPDHLMILYADGLWQMMEMARLAGRRRFPASLPIEAWLYRGGFTYPDATRLKDSLSRALFTRAVRGPTLTALHLDDEIMHDYASRRARPGRGPRLVLTPNPVQLFEPLDKAEARRRLHVREEGRLLVATGMIAPYKGAVLLIDGFERFLADQPHSDVRLLLAGPHSDEVKTRLAESEARRLVKQGRIISIDRFISGEEMFIASAAADLILAPYPRHSGRSSIILWAAAAGRPSLGADRGCIGHVIRTQRLGRTAPDLAPGPLAADIQTALRTPWTDQDARRARAYAASHSVENYQRSASALLRDRLGEPPWPAPTADAPAAASA